MRNYYKNRDDGSLFKGLLLKKEKNRSLLTGYRFSTTILFLFVVLLSSMNAVAQASYTYGWEPTGLGSWTSTNVGTGLFSRNTTGACTGSAYIRANIYYDGTSTLTSPSLGTSNQGIVTFGFSYKAIQFEGGAAATGNLIDIKAQWANSTSGPWTTFHTINSSNHTPSTGCINVSTTFSPGLGNLYVRFLTKAIGSTTDLYFFYDNISVAQGAAPTCFTPLALIGTTPTPTSANLSWTAPATAPATGYQWEVRSSGAAGSGTTGLASSGTTAAGTITATASTLTPNTTYTLHVRSDCGSGDFSTWAQSSTFTTPLSCFPATAVSGTATTPTSANLSWTAPTTVPSTGYQWEVRSSGAGGSGAIGLADSGSTVAGIVTASSSLLAANTTYRLYVRSNCGAGDFSTWAQSSTFTTPLSCFPATAVSGTATTPTSANLSWTAPTTAPSTGYQWEVRTTGAGGSGATGLVDSGSTAAGIVTASSSLLSANTTYRLYVRSNCGASDFSTWAQSATFRTPCTSTAFPVPIEGFNATGLPACWSASAITNTWSGFIGGSGDISGPYSGSGFMEKNYLTSSALLISMPIDLTSVTTQARINMFMHRHASADVNDQYIVYVNTVPSLTGATQLLSLYSKTTIAPTVAATGWHQNFINIPTSFNSSTNVYVIVEGKTSGGFTSYDLGIDDFSVENVPADLPDFVSLHSPANSAIQIGTGTVINAQVFEAGLTDVEPGLSGQATGIVGAIGISPIGSNTNPNTWTTWMPATYDALVTGANDGYKATIGAGLASGTYYYAARFSLNGGAFVYGGINSSNVGGIWDGATFVSGVLTVNALTNDDCSGAIALAIGTQLTTSNVSATKSVDETPSCGALNFPTNGKDVWYSVVVPPNVSRLDIETNNNADAAFADSAIQAYRGVCGSLVSIECDDDDSTDGSFSLLNLTALTPGETLYIRVWGYDGASGSFKIKASVPACGTETRWNGTAWSNGTPVTGIRAVMAGDYNGAGFTACAMDVIGTSQVTFTSGSNVTLNGLLNVATTASMTMESNANLVQTVAGTNVGNVTVKRESAQLVRLDHTLWSSPVTGQKLFAFSPNTLTNRFYVYNTPTNTYVTTGLSATTDFVVGKGYGIRASNNHPETPTKWMGSFAGNPNNGDKSFTLALTGTGFNLVGNPYPSVIDAAAFVTANSARINGTLYFYAHTLTMSTTGTFPAGTNYALWNATGQTAATLGTSGVPALTPNGKIQVGQGFLVKATAAGSANFTNAMREASNGNQFFRMASQVQSTTDAERHRFWLNLTNAEGTTFNQMLVGYVSGATQEVDNLYDGLAFGNEGSALSSRLADADYTIQGRALPFNQADIVPLSFKAITPGNYNISLADMDGVFAGDQNVYIRDNSNGSINNIKLAPFAFTSDTGTFNSRFEVIYQTNLGTAESTFSSNSIVTYVQNAQLNIQTKGSSMKSVAFYDIRGRLLLKQSGINNTNFVAQGLVSQNQVLLVQVTSENDEVATIKVMF